MLSDATEEATDETEVHKASGSFSEIKAQITQILVSAWKMEEHHKR